MRSWIVLVVVVVAGCTSLPALRPDETTTARPREVVVQRARPAPRVAPPQFVLISFDGAGGERLWTYWRSVARRAHAHFTFFVSGVYLLDEARRDLYRPPRHEPGSSDIGFARPRGDAPARDVVRGTLRQIVLAHREGHEIGTHFNGHFCSGYDGSVGEWDAPDWRLELAEFDKLFFHASANNGLRPPVRLPFGPEEVVGARTPCLEGRVRRLYPVLAERGFRYDASGVGVLGDRPRRRHGIWRIPLLQLPFGGHTFRVVSMDYNFLANQTGSPAEIERETYLTLRNAFRETYRGNRAPFTFANHFETWHRWAYNHALERFLLETCRLPDVRCASYRELVDRLDSRSSTASIPIRYRRRSSSGACRAALARSSSRSSSSGCSRSASRSSSRR